MIKHVKTSKKKFALIALASMLVVIVSVCIPMLIYWNGREPNRAEGEDLQYYTRIEAAVKTQKQIALSDIFAFDWDKVYLQESPRMSEEELSTKLGFHCDLPPLEDWFGYPYRVLFIKNDRVVYEFLYDQIYLAFESSELILNKSDATFTVTSTRLPITLGYKK